MESAITSDYIILGSCIAYSQKLNNHKSSTNNNQMQVSRLTPDDEEVRTPILEEIIIEEFKQE